MPSSHTAGGALGLDIKEDRAVSEVSRIFSDEELQQAGRLTVDLVEEALDAGNTSEASSLCRRFMKELMVMYFSYTGWEASILDCVEQRDGVEHRETTLAAMQDYALAPEREVMVEGVAKAWEDEIASIVDLISVADFAEAVARIKTLRETALRLHDGMLSRVAALLSDVYERHGADQLAYVFSQVMKPESMDPKGDVSFRDRVESIMLFTRSHLLPFSVTEDAEKVTFSPDPCPSGARLIREGHYDAPRNNAIVKHTGPLTYGKREFPVYCCHEPALELGSALRTGVPLFVVDAPEDVGITPCKVHVYKEPSDIPEEYYRRLGLSKPEDLIAVSS